MTPKELLAPRYRVINDYPNNNNYPVGSIIYEHPVHKFNLLHPENYPNIFNKLEWWEERKIEELPKFVKSNYTVGSIKQDEVYKVGAWHDYEEAYRLLLSIKTAIHYAIIDEKPNRLNISHFIPATEEEYLNKKITKQPHDRPRTTQLPRERSSAGRKRQRCD